MSREPRRSGTERMKYGMCLNEECENNKNKVIIKLRMRDDMVCPVCGKELRECNPPTPTDKWKIIVAAVAAAALIGGGVWWGVSDRQAPVEEQVQAPAEEQVQAPAEEQVQAPAEEQVAEPVKKPAPKTAKPASGTGKLNLSYGTYSGEIKGGYPHGQGKLVYKSERVINRNDIKQRTAKAGEYVIGEFFNGFVVYGKHYDSAGNLIGSLNFGVGSENSFDDK